MSYPSFRKCKIDRGVFWLFAVLEDTTRMAGTEGREGGGAAQASRLEGLVHLGGGGGGRVSEWRNNGLPGGSRVSGALVCGQGPHFVLRGWGRTLRGGLPPPCRSSAAGGSGPGEREGEKGCTWCTLSRRSAPAPPQTPTSPPRRPSCRRRHGRPSCATRSRPPPPTPPKPSANGSRSPTPRPGRSAPPRDHTTTTPGRERARARGGQGTERETPARGHGRAHKGEAGAHRDRAPEATQRKSRKPLKGQEGAGTGTEAQRKRTPRRARVPTRRKGIRRRRDQRRLTPSGRCTTPGGARPQHTPPKHKSDALRITPAHAQQPPETTQGMEGTPTRGEPATPTEKAAGNTAAQPTTTP